MTAAEEGRFLSDDAGLDRVVAGVSRSAAYACEVSIPQQNGLNAASLLMTVDGQPIRSGDRMVHGIGYCADAALGALLLSRWGDLRADVGLTKTASGLFEHSIGSGYLDAGIPIHLYRDAATGEFLNTIEGNPLYLDVGHMAHALANLLRYVRRYRSKIPRRLESASRRLHAFIAGIERCPDGWIPRRLTHDGRIHPYRRVLPDLDGKFPLLADKVSRTSGAGLYVVDFLIAGESLGLWDGEVDVRTLSDAFVTSGGHFGSINTDTDVEEESFALALAVVTLLASARRHKGKEWVEFALDGCLPRLTRYRITDAPKESEVNGLYRLADTYPAACMGENAVIALAYLQASRIDGRAEHRRLGLDTLLAMTCHNRNTGGFLPSEIDWTGMRSPDQHIDGAPVGPRLVTHPYRNNLQWVDAAFQLLDPDGCETGLA